MAELRQRAGKAQEGAEKQEKKEQGQEEVTDGQPAVDKVKAKREKALTVWWIIAPLSLVALWTFSSAPADLKAYTDDFMTAAVYTRFGSPLDVVEVVDDVPVPRPLADDVVIKVHAASVNPVDYKMVAGVFGVPMKLGILPGPPARTTIGFDFAGTVASLGPDTSGNLNIGDRVMVYQDFTRQNAFAEYALVKESLVVPMPASMSYEQAAAVLLAGATSLQALRKHTNVQEGSRVLILGGSGGTGSLAIQIAKHYGAIVATTASDRNLEFVADLGADQVINYRKENFGEVLHGGKFDVVYDCVGGLEHWEQSHRVLKHGGAYVTIVGDRQVKFNFNGLAYRAWVTVRRFFSFLNPKGISYTAFTAWANAKDVQTLADMFEAGDLQAPIDSTFSLKQTAQALAKSEAGRARGKIVITVAE